jgi:hypothetical protein
VALNLLLNLETEADITKAKELANRPMEEENDEEK